MCSLCAMSTLCIALLQLLLLSYNLACAVDIHPLILEEQEALRVRHLGQTTLKHVNLLPTARDDYLATLVDKAEASVLILNYCKAIFEGPRLTPLAGYDYLSALIHISTLTAIVHHAH